MQTTMRPTGLLTAASDYVTLVQQAKNKIKGFEQLYKELKCAEVIKQQLKAPVHKACGMALLCWNSKK
jgi:hypothetical protein